MHTYPVYFFRAPVYYEASLGIKFRGAKAEAVLAHVDDFRSLIQNALQGIKIAFVNIPQLWVVYTYGAVHTLGASDFLALGGDNCVNKLVPAVFLRFDIHVPHAVFKARRKIHAVLVDILVITYFKTHVSVYSRSAVPAGIGRLVSYQNVYRVFTLVKIIGNIETEAGITVFPVACGLFVHIYGAVHINAVKADRKSVV